jgi:hypothetical protein
MQYQVPQFIEIEDKIVGPLTIKQFIYLAGTGGLCLVYVFYLPLVFTILLMVPTVALGVALAFYKMNGKPFIEILEAGFNYYIGAKFFLWKHVDTPVKQPTEAAKAAAAAEAAAAVEKHTPKLTRGKLTELAWSLDVPKDQQTAAPETLHGSIKSGGETTL